jgi:hypothetical protein
MDYHTRLRHHDLRLKELLKSVQEDAHQLQLLYADRRNFQDDEDDARAAAADRLVEARMALMKARAALEDGV